MAVSQRKRLGAWYTPHPLVQAVVDEVVPAWVGTGDVVRVLDPACGDGRFLDAVAIAVRRRGATPVLTGIDIDPHAPVFAGDVGAGAAELSGAELIRADALSLQSLSGRRFDIVVGNPPFLNQLAVATSRGGSSRHGGGPYADAAAEFLALAVSLVSDGGRVGMVLPQSLLAARDAGAIRDAIDAHAALRWMWWSPTSVFDANVRTWAGVWQTGASAAGVAVRRSFGARFQPLPAVEWNGSWPGLIADGERPSDDGRATLGSIARFCVDFRDQYYGLVGAVGDEVDGPPLITSGLIDRDVCWWGERPVRFAKSRFAAPRVALDRLSPLMRRWAAQRLVPKILVANQTSAIEAVADRLGEWLPGVPVHTCITDDIDRVLAVLHSPPATEWVRYHAAGSGLSASAVRMTPALLASIPLPA